MKNEWKADYEEDGAVFWPSVADMAVATCIIFVVFWTAQVYLLQKEKQAVKKSTQTISSLNEDLRQLREKLAIYDKFGAKSASEIAAIISNLENRNLELKSQLDKLKLNNLTLTGHNRELEDKLRKFDGIEAHLDGKSKEEIIFRLSSPDHKDDGSEDPIFTQIQLDREDLLERLKVGMENAGFHVEHNRKNGILRFPATLLFDPGEAALKGENGEQALAILGKLLENEVDDLMKDQQRHKLEAIYLEGHTDNKPISGKYVDNWDLSVARATNSYRAMLNGSAKLAALKNTEGKSLLSVSGYGAERPVENNSNKNEEERKANRRIDIRFVMAPPPIDAYRRNRERK